MSECVRELSQGGREGVTCAWLFVCLVTATPAFLKYLQIGIRAYVYVCVFRSVSTRDCFYDRVTLSQSI